MPLFIFSVNSQRLRCLLLMNKAVFLDRDGTINKEKNYLYKIEDFEFLPGVIKGLKSLQDAGFLLIVVTNQSGIARGMYTEKDFQKLNDWMIATLKEKGVVITQTYYCPHLPDAKNKTYRVDCGCRKPKLGMFSQAVADFDIDYGQSFAIGDKLRDCAVCETTACRGFLIGQNESEETIEKVKNGVYKRVMYAKDFSEAVKRIDYFAR